MFLKLVKILKKYKKIIIYLNINCQHSSLSKIYRNNNSNKEIYSNSCINSKEIL